MTLEEMIARFRKRADDNVAPYFSDDLTVTDWLNDAQEEAAIRARLIHESANATVCEIDVVAETAVYTLHSSVYEITHISYAVDGDSTRTTMKLVSTGWLDKNVSDWRTESGEPRYAVQDENTLRIVPNPEAAGTIFIECYRLPIVRIEDETDEPEIHKANHRHLIDWALFQHFSIPDAESFDPTRAAKAEADFDAWFGLSPDADLRRITRHDTPHVVQPDWP